MNKTEDIQCTNLREGRMREFISSLGVSEYLDLTHSKLMLLPKLEEHLTGFHFLSEKFKPIELVEFYTLNIDDREERLARIYCSLIVASENRSYVPTIVIGSVQTVSSSTRRDCVSVEKLEERVIFESQEISRDQLASVPGMKRILEAGDVSVAVRPSSLRLSEVHQLHKHIQLRIFRDMTDMESGNFVALINYIDPKIPLFEGHCCIMLKSVHPREKTRRETG